ncbi:protein of unknown function [Xenorhabdus bovienii]|uniref:Uncharacterized protein n=1 Tax=Xenorhabdus bovienii TaxID=40576 RepID=A0A0B6XFQ8_XENBV|nr:protein of unknown function [Xenorhabdus bovienii]
MPPAALRHTLLKGHDTFQSDGKMIDQQKLTLATLDESDNAS